MTPQTTLNAVRELSERALLRPAPTRLHLTRPEDLRPTLKPAPVPYEELCPIRIGGSLGTAGNNRPRKHQEQHCPECGKRPQYCYCNVKPREKDFMRAALDKTAAATERRLVVLPAGEGSIA
jgi:hypothetical protein